MSRDECMGQHCRKGCLMRTKSMYAMVAIFMAVSVIQAADQKVPELTVLKQTYAKNQATIDAEKVQQEAKALNTYANSLSAYRAQLKQGGQLKAYLAINKELDRLAEEKIFSPPTVTSSYVKRAAEEYGQSISKAAAVHQQKTSKLLGQYVNGLKRLIKKLMQADRIADAAAVQFEIDRCEFILADIVVKTPRPEAEPPVVQRKPIPRGASAYGGHHYRVFGGNISWQKARTECEDMGGHLACIGDLRENRFIARLTKGKAAWIGGTDEKDEGRWEWINGEPFNYINWYPGQPDNTTGSEHYLHIGVSWHNKPEDWNDAAINGYGKHIVGYICEWDY